jgi:hypothetical protein
MHKFSLKEIAMSYLTICCPAVASAQQADASFRTRFVAELTRLLAQMAARR